MTDSLRATREHASALKALRVIPGVGPSIAQDLYELGIRQVCDLHGRDPQELYEEHCTQKGQLVDRCVLYVFRCAVFFAETKDPDPELLKWWAWKDTPATD